MMALSRELAVFVAPFINSYKRYASLSWAPVNVVWGRDNRTTGFRLVGRGPALHVENRFPGGDMNAYLTYAAMIGAGLYGIEHGLKLEPEYKGNGYLATGDPRMPRALYEAIGELERPRRPARSSARTSWTTTSTPPASSRRRTTRWSTRGTASATWSAAEARRTALLSSPRPARRECDRRVTPRWHWPDPRALRPRPPHPRLGRGRPTSTRRGARDARRGASRRGAPPGRPLPDRRGRQRGTRP